MAFSAELEEGMNVGLLRLKRSTNFDELPDYMQTMVDAAYRSGFLSGIRFEAMRISETLKRPLE